MNGDRSTSAAQAKAQASQGKPLEPTDASPHCFYNAVDAHHPLIFAFWLVDVRADTQYRLQMA